MIDMALMFAGVMALGAVLVAIVVFVMVNILP
jgi:hypothetical protein